MTVHTTENRDDKAPQALTALYAEKRAQIDVMSICAFLRFGGNMLCPHCNKEIEGIIPFKPIVIPNLATAAANPMPSYLINAVCGAQPVSFPQTLMLNLNANGCAGGQTTIIDLGK